MTDLERGRLEFHDPTFRPMSELRRYAVQQPVEAAHTIRDLQDAVDHLRTALEHAMEDLDKLSGFPVPGITVDRSTQYRAVLVSVAGVARAHALPEANE